MCFAIKASCVCVTSVAKSESTETFKPNNLNFGFHFSEQGAEGPSLVPQPTKTTSGQGMETYLRIKGGGCTWVFVTAGGPHEEFLGPSWQLESSPLTKYKTCT